MHNNIDEEIKKVQDYILKNNRIDISLDSVKHQLHLFVNGVLLPHLVKPCTPGDGIFQLKEDEYFELISAYESAAKGERLTKFVPASGAASRMFQKLQSVLNLFDDFSLSDLKKKSKNDKECKNVLKFLVDLPKFAFYDDLKNGLNVDDSGIEKLINDSPTEVLKAVLFDKGLNYSSKPKGAVKFHRYKDDSRTAFEEQIYEAFNYVVDKKNKAKIHFTISEEHTELFTQIIEELKFKLSKTDFNVDLTYSFQKRSTDIIAVDLENKIIFDKSGNLVLRPGGHGALLENLNDLKADIVIIKNIDNLTTEDHSADTILYKKLLIGYLIKIQNQVFDFLNSLDRKDFYELNFNEIMKFAEQYLFISKPIDFENWNEKRKNKFLFDKLNRPIRVCGMVKNQGEPGGGPFWISDKNGELSLQIIEQAQINTHDEKQQNIFKQSTHFNPVDLICGLKDFKRSNFDLHKFVDHQSGIITKKTKDGVELKALELPGLWNGSMAYWNTIFVEVPISTFNPVKEVNDLLKPAHQN
jgi:hypothetical protein